CSAFCGDGQGLIARSGNGFRIKQRWNDILGHQFCPKLFCLLLRYQLAVMAEQQVIISMAHLRNRFLRPEYRQVMRRERVAEAILCPASHFNLFALFARHLDMLYESSAQTKIFEPPAEI